MAFTAEEQRALDYQAAQRERLAFQRSLQSTLRAPADPAKTVKDRWEPIINRNRRFPDGKPVR